MSTRTPGSNPPSSTPAGPSQAKRSPASSYQEIERRVTPLPDSSHRPTEAEAEEAELEKPVKVAGDGVTSTDTVQAAVAGLDHVDTSDLALDLVGGRVTVSGSVARADDRDRIVAAIQGVAGVTEVVDQLRVRL